MAAGSPLRGLFVWTAPTNNTSPNDVVAQPVNSIYRDPPATTRAVGALQKNERTGGLTRHGDRYVVVREQRAVTRHRAQDVRARLLESRLTHPLTVGRRLGNDVWRRPWRVRVHARVHPRLQLVGDEGHHRGLPSVDYPRQRQAGSPACSK